MGLNGREVMTAWLTYVEGLHSEVWNSVKSESTSFKTVFSKSENMRDIGGIT